jgi:protocatechuate 3,4-dioxygenase beta subunit
MRRREFLFGSFGFLWACTVPTQQTSESSPDLLSPQDLAPTAQCAETQDDAEGPYYKAGAPVRSDFGGTGTPLVLGGRVLSSAGCAALVGATLDIWQADGNADYDSVGFRMRGTQLAGAGGAWSLRTVMPGHYLNGTEFRPAHVHVKVSAPGHVPLTTQLYFVGDPYNDSDPFFKPSLAIALADGSDGKSGTFDIVLKKS